MESMQELGISYIKDSMGGDAAGAFWFLQSLNPDDEFRSTSQGFLVPRSNLHVLTGNIVTRVLFDAGEATGVEFSEGEELETNVIMVTKEVILSAGALHTPQILQLSGIGDAGLLSSLGIEVVENLPGVGENYQDHLLFFTGQTGESVFIQNIHAHIFQ
jgi:choline dehydrogenase-like flavoprotein